MDWKYLLRVLKAVSIANLLAQLLAGHSQWIVMIVLGDLRTSMMGRWTPPWTPKRHAANSDDHMVGLLLFLYLLSPFIPSMA
jgi:hypothetical protein